MDVVKGPAARVGGLPLAWSWRGRYQAEVHPSARHATFKCPACYATVPGLKANRITGITNAQGAIPGQAGTGDRAVGPGSVRDGTLRAGAIRW